MFKKNTKATIQFSHETEGFSMNSTSVPLTDGKLVEYLKEEIERHGEVVIRHISDDNEIILTNSRTMEYRDNESRLEELNEVIRNYIQGRAIPMEAHAVFAEGILKGVFGNPAHASLKRKNLISKGFAEEKVEIKPIQVDSFEDQL